MYKLGDKVTFDKILIKTNNCIDFNGELTQQEENDLEEKEFVISDVLKEKEINKISGIVSGIRYLKSKRFIKQHINYDGENNYEHYYHGEIFKSEYIKVYLIANKMNFFYKVKEEWIIDCEK